MQRWIMLAIVSGALGCGGSMAAAPPRAATSVQTAESGEADHVGGAGAQSQEDWDTLIGMSAQLDEGLEMAEIDCDSARDLASSICELAGRVCEIAEETADPTTVERCDDGQARCARAQDRTQNVCP